ncbi:MAG TPA: M15 family metallopeptidase [Hyphomicrobium sp.]|jgi:D-alanyl-D-alanine dipeptidase
MRRSLGAALLFFSGVCAALAGERPSDIVDAATIVPGLQLDMRYPTPDNFVGRPIVGYRAPKCYLTKRAAEALKGVQEELAKQNLGLKVYDCYRPRSAVKDFVRWGRDLSDRKMKARFYPNVKKRSLFRSGYISSKSGHSRGSTVDLTIVPLPAPPQPPYDASAPLTSCEGSKEARAPDNSLDMGTGFDCFSRRSHTAFAGVGAEQKKNRRLLRSTMSQHGFRNLTTEWWHYTLRNEPYPNTYFDFPVE